MCKRVNITKTAFSGGFVVLLCFLVGVSLSQPF